VPQPAHVSIEEGAKVVHAIFEHGKTVDAAAEGEPLPLLGIERIAMLKYGIPDLRTFYESDLRWLRHYGFLPLDIPSLVGGPAR
jgi:hypothetical protein